MNGLSVESFANKLIQKDGYFELQIDSTEVDDLIEFLRLDKEYLSIMFERMFKKFFNQNKDYFPAKAITEFKNFIFRGQADSSWHLIPASLREENSQHKSEIQGCFDLINVCDEMSIPIPSDNYDLREKLKLAIENGGLQTNNWISSDYYELLAYAQHYGVNTRLLDWSYHPLVSLYFSSVDWLGKEPTTQFFSIYIFCIDDLREELKDECIKIDTPKGLNKHISKQRGCFILIKQCDFINSAKTRSIFKALNHSENPSQIKHMNDIIKAHQKDYKLLKIDIPISCAKTIFQYCNNMNFNAAQLFEGNEAIKKRLKEITFL